MYPNQPFTSGQTSNQQNFDDAPPSYGFDLNNLTQPQQPRPRAQSCNPPSYSVARRTSSPFNPNYQPEQQQQEKYGLLQESYGSSQGSYGQPSERGPILVPAPNFNATNDAAALRRAMRRFGTNANVLISILCRRSMHQRLKIREAYKAAYGKDLIDDIKSETKHNFQKVLVALLLDKFELYARDLHDAVYGPGTDETVLIEIMCTMPNYEVEMIKMTYERIYGKSLVGDLRDDTSGHFKKLMTSLACANRDESMATDLNEARWDAQELKRAGIDKLGTDESVFNQILCLRNYEQIKLISQEYRRLTGHGLDQDIKSEFSGDIEQGLLTILRYSENGHELYARKLHKSMVGLGTNDRDLIRLVITRSEIDMIEIKHFFLQKYGKTLKSFIKGDTSGNYKHALYALIGEERSSSRLNTL